MTARWPDEARAACLITVGFEAELAILATDPSLEGEATATFIARLLADTGVSVTRLASGLPVGGDLEYADEETLAKALENRREI